MPRPSNRRTKYFIEKSFQLRYAFSIAGICAVASTLAIISLYLLIWTQALSRFSDESVSNALKMTTQLQQYSEARFSSSTQVKQVPPRLAFLEETSLFSERQREVLGDILKNAQLKTIALAIIALALFGFISIYYSHRVSGPHFHFMKVFRDLECLDLTTRIHLRKHDEGRYMEEAFNGAMDQLDIELGEIKKLLKTNADQPDFAEKLALELKRFRTTREF